MKGTVLIIGAHGMLGRPVTRRLLADGFSVKALCRNPKKARDTLHGACPGMPESGNVKVIQGDLVDIPSIDAGLEGCFAVYVSVDTPPKTKSGFRPETDGLRNVVKALKNHSNTRLLILSALSSSIPEAKTHPWWHVKEKHEAQGIARASNVPWTIFEPTWFMESLPLFVKNKKFYEITGTNLEPYWIAGDDYGRMISAALSDDKGVNETIPVQGRNKLSLHDAARQFIEAYDSSIKTARVPFWTLKLAAPFSAQVNEFVSLLKFCRNYTEPTPDPVVWKKYAEPVMDIKAYAAYVHRTGDFPQK